MKNLPFIHIHDISIYIIFIRLIYISVNLPLIHVQLPYLWRSECKKNLGGSITECRDGLADPVDARVVADDGVEGIHHDHLKAFCLFCQIYIYILLYMYTLLYKCIWYIYTERERAHMDIKYCVSCLFFFVLSVFPFHATLPRLVPLVNSILCHLGLYLIKGDDSAGSKAFAFVYYS